MKTLWLQKQMSHNKHISHSLNRWISAFAGIWITPTLNLFFILLQTQFTDFVIIFAIFGEWYFEEDTFIEIYISIVSLSRRVLFSRRGISIIFSAFNFFSVYFIPNFSSKAVKYIIAKSILCDAYPRHVVSNISFTFAHGTRNYVHD